MDSLEDYFTKKEVEILTDCTIWDFIIKKPVKLGKMMI